MANEKVQIIPEIIPVSRHHLASIRGVLHALGTMHKGDDHHNEFTRRMLTRIDTELCRWTNEGKSSDPFSSLFPTESN